MFNYSRMFRLTLNILMFLSLFMNGLFLPTAAYADSTITVATNADLITSDGLCSLPEAITNANADAQTYTDCVAGSANDTIQFNDALGTSTIILNSTLPNITDADGLTINGDGDITISGNDLYRILIVQSELTLNGLTLTHGRCSSCVGGGVYSSGGDITITNSTISNNDGSGLYVYEATVIVTNTTFSNNNATYGGAIHIYINPGSEETATITDSIFSGNTTPSGGGGSSIYNYANTTITNTTFKNNTSGRGSIYNDGSLSITDGTFSGNTAIDGGGGAIYNSGSLLNISDSTFSGNSATGSGYGGGIFNNTTLAITNSTFSTNTAAQPGGAIYSYTDSDLTVTNSTFSGNTAPSGGGIYARENISLSVRNSTFSANEGSGAGILNYNSDSFILQNTILANSGSDEDCYNVSGDIITTNTNNLIETNGASGHMCGTPTLSADPVLGPLANNGGSTQTFALTAGSPAVNAGNDAVCAASPVNNTSQNGVIRPSGAHCDIGSFELDVVAPVISSIVRANPDPTALSSVNFTVTFSELVTGVNTSDFTLTTTGVSASAISGVSGSGSSYTVSVDTGVGNGTIRLDLIDNDSIQDASLNPLGGVGAANGNFNSGQTYTVTRSAIFVDVPYNYWANAPIERLYDAGITGGCSASPLNYCPDNLVTRDQMAVFLERGIHGSSFFPPNVIPTFNDTAGNFAEDWIEALKNDGITAGCGTNIYCPSQGVTRAQMAIFLERAMHGASFTPPNVTPTFTDTVGNFAEDWIEALKNDGITSGCGPNTYCPDAIVTRAQMAVFLVAAFGLP